MARPSGIVAWATNILFAAGASVGQATKVEPSAGLKADGWSPGTTPPAKMFNWLLGRITALLAHYDLLELNFAEPSTILFALGATGHGNIDTNPGTDTGEMSWAPFDPLKKMIYVNNGQAIFESSDGGITWTKAVDTAGLVFRGVTCNPETGTAVTILESGGAARYATIGSADGTWNATALSPAGVTCAVVVADPFEECFWVGGTIAADPAIWKLTDELGAAATQTAVTVAGAPVDITNIAAGPTYKLAAAVTSGSSIFRWQDGDAAATAVTGPWDAEEVMDLQWLPEDELFLLSATDGTDTRIYTSPEGATGTWTLRETMTGTVFKQRSMAVWGALIVAYAELASGASALHYSIDAGSTWALLPDPLVRYGGSSEDGRVRQVGNRLAVFDYKSSADTVYVLGHRVGPVL